MNDAIYVSKTMRWLMTRAFQARHALLWPARLMGFMGTLRHPYVLERGSPVPFWLLSVYPNSMRAEVRTELECYFEYATSQMVVRPAEPITDCMVRIAHRDGASVDGMCAIGAPTLWSGDGSTAGLSVDEHATRIAAATN